MSNQVIVVGRLANDIKLENNKCEIILSVNRPFKNEEGIYETDLISCLLWNGVAENTAEYCKKGDLVGVKGRLQTEDNKLIVIAEKITFLSSKKEEE